MPYKPPADGTRTPLRTEFYWNPIQAGAFPTWSPELNAKQNPHLEGNPAYVELDINKYLDASRQTQTCRIVPVYVIGEIKAGKPVIIFSHGNAQVLDKNLVDLGKAMSLWGLPIVLYDYCGYGASADGAANEANAFSAIEAVSTWVNVHGMVPANRQIMMGWSIGTGAAAYLAATRPCMALILMSAYTSLTEVVIPVDVPVANMFKTKDRIRDVRCPILLLHGSDDVVIRSILTQRLYDIAKQVGKDVEMTIFPGIGHFLFEDPQGRPNIPLFTRIAVFLRKLGAA